MTPTARILVVDDEAAIRFFLEEALARDGHQVVAVESGEAALEQIATQEFDLALLDLRLKGISGIEVLAEMRRRSPDTTVIVLTAHASLETAVEALRHGAHDYLFKPCKTVELRESVRSGLLKRQRELRQREILNRLETLLAGEESCAETAEQASTLLKTPPAENEEERFHQQGGLIVDMMRHIVTLDGHFLELSPTEFNLLAYLVSEAPRVVSAQELVREVQRYETAPWEARDIVRYHIYHIRQKIRQATGRADIIRTVRGVGYTVAI